MSRECPAATCRWICTVPALFAIAALFLAAHFDRAVLVRANFTATTLDGCSFADANLGGAVFTGARGRGAPAAPSSRRS